MSAKGQISLLLLVTLGFGGVWNLQKHIDAQQAALQIEDDQVLIRSGKLMKVLSLEYSPLLADIYWTRVVQYFGNKHAGKQVDLRLLWPLLDLSSTLDPESDAGVPLRLHVFERRATPRGWAARSGGAIDSSAGFGRIRTSGGCITIWDSSTTST